MSVLEGMGRHQLQRGSIGWLRHGGIWDAPASGYDLTPRENQVFTAAYQHVGHIRHVEGPTPVKHCIVRCSSSWSLWHPSAWVCSSVTYLIPGKTHRVKPGCHQRLGTLNADQTQPMTFSEGYDIQSMVPPIRSGRVAGAGGANEGDYTPAPITLREHSLAPINEEYIPAPINQDDTKASINQGEYTPALEHIIFFDYAQITIRTFFAWRGSYISSCMRYISLHLNCTYSL
jgi:hypothetical protein